MSHVRRRERQSQESGVRSPGKVAQPLSQSAQSGPASPRADYSVFILGDTSDKTSARVTGDMGDWARIILSPEAASSRFHDKVLVLASGDTVTITRSHAGEKPETENAVFDCRVRIMSAQQLLM